MKNGFELLDTYLRNNIVSFLNSKDIKSFSRQNKDCAFSCAVICSQKYAECIATNQSVSRKLISVLRKVVRVEDVKELSIFIVDKIFEITGSILLRKTYRLPSLLMELMNGYHIKDLDHSKIFDNCIDIPLQIIQHVIQCCVTNNYLYTKKSADDVHESKEDVVTAFIRNRASLYCLMTSLDSQFSYSHYKFIVASYEDIFLSPRGFDAVRIQMKTIFDTAVDEVELVIDVGRRMSFPDG